MTELQEQSSLENVVGQMKQHQIQRKQAIEEGVQSLQALIKVAQGGSGQSLIIATFLVCLYNGNVYRFDLTDFRSLDTALFDHCMRVLRMDARFCEREIHKYFQNGSELFQELIHSWQLLAKMNRYGEFVKEVHQSCKD